MSLLTRRTQLLLDEERYRALEREAKESGQSVASIIRAAIDDKLARGTQAARRGLAARSLLDAPAPLYDAEPEWDDVKGDLRGG